MKGYTWHLFFNFDLFFTPKQCNCLLCSPKQSERLPLKQVVEWGPEGDFNLLGTEAGQGPCPILWELLLPDALVPGLSSFHPHPPCGNFLGASASLTIHLSSLSLSILAQRVPLEKQWKCLPLLIRVQDSMAVNMCSFACVMK